MPAITDYFTGTTNGTRPEPTTVTGIRAISGTVLQCNALTGWEVVTPVHFATYRLDANGAKIAGSQCDWKGIGSGTTITQLTLKAGTDVGNAIGDVVVCMPTAAWAEDLVAGITTHTNQDGTLKTTSVQSALGLGSDALNGWNPYAVAVNSVTSNGNRSYDVVFASDVSATLSAGMRVRTTRTVAANQNSFLLDGTNDYYNKTTPAGLSFTTTLTCSAWVYMTAYGANSYIINRRNADTDGWSLIINPTGQVGLVGLRVASNNKQIASYQSIPLNKWVHVAATMDMAAADTSAQKIWIDGVEVPRSYSLTGTATALVQGTQPLAIGARSSDGASPFPGYIDQAAVFSSQLSDATIKAMIHQGLTGSESTLVSAYANGSVTDLNTTNANNLTAQNGATTVASAPFGDRGTSSTLDYGLIMKVATTTVTVQVPEGCTIPTTGGVSAVAYSTQANPYGWVSDKGRWGLASVLRTQQASTSNATYGSFISSGWAIRVPAGDWGIGYDATLLNSAVTIVTFNLSPNTGIVGTARGTEDLRFSASIISSYATGTNVVTAYRQQNEQQSSAQTWVMYSVGATTGAGVDGDNSNCALFAIPSSL